MNTALIAPLFSCGMNWNMQNGKDRILATTPAYQPWVLCASTVRRPRAKDYGGHDWYSLWSVRTGMATLRRGARTLDRLTAGALVLLQPRSRLRFVASAACQYRFVEFDVVCRPREPRRQLPALKPKDAKDRHPVATEVWGVDLPSVIPSAFAIRGTAIIDAVASEWWRGPLHLAQCNARIGGFMASLALWVGGAAESEYQERIEGTRAATTWYERCVQYARRHLESGLSVQEWARAFGLSRQQFRARIEAEADRSPQLVLADLKIEVACRYLRDPSKPVENISRICGYGDPSVFARFFKKHVGLSPSQWRSREALPD